MKKFRVYIRKSSLYYLVQVWDTKAEMLEHRKQVLNFEDNHEELDCEAYVDPYDAYKVSKKVRGKPQKSRKLAILGELNLHKARLGTEVLTHETIHVVTSYMRRRSKKFAILDRENDFDDNYMEFEEEFAYAVGRFARDLVCKLRDHKFIR